jgi:WD40 repeat protein
MEGTISIWDGNSGQLLTKMEKDFDDIQKVSYNSQTKKLYYTFLDHSIKVLDGVTGEMLKELKEFPHGSQLIAWSPDGNQVAFSCGDQYVRKWRVF